MVRRGRARAGRGPALLEQEAGANRVLRAGQRVFDRAVAAGVDQRIQKTLSAFHAAHPLDPGMPREAASRAGGRACRSGTVRCGGRRSDRAVRSCAARIGLRAPTTSRRSRRRRCGFGTSSSRPCGPAGSRRPTWPRLRRPAAYQRPRPGSRAAAGSRETAGQAGHARPSSGGARAAAKRTSARLASRESRRRSNSGRGDLQGTVRTDPKICDSVAGMAGSGKGNAAVRETRDLIIG